MSAMLLMIKMKVLSENRMELSKEIAFLIVSIGTKNGCAPAGV
jgi:hypothetical protein